MEMQRTTFHFAQMRLLHPHSTSFLASQVPDLGVPPHELNQVPYFSGCTSSRTGSSSQTTFRKSRGWQEGNMGRPTLMITSELFRSSCLEKQGHLVIWAV